VLEGPRTFLWPVTIGSGNVLRWKTTERCDDRAKPAASDDDLGRANGPRPVREPLLTLAETCWRMRSLQKASRILSCGIYGDNAPGLEVRCGYSDDHLLRSQRTAEIGSAREIAEAWRQAVIAKGGFTELTGDETPAVSDGEAETESLRQEYQSFGRRARLWILKPTRN